MDKRHYGQIPIRECRFLHADGTIEQAIERHNFPAPQILSGEGITQFPVPDKDGSFEFVRQEIEMPANPIQSTTISMLLEGCRRADEKLDIPEDSQPAG